jgi:hypothetical protein
MSQYFLQQESFHRHFDGSLQEDEFDIKRYILCEGLFVNIFHTTHEVPR